MKKRKKLYCMTKPYPQVHHVLTTMGFSAVGSLEGCDYDRMIYDPSADRTYWLRIPTTGSTDGFTEVVIGQADFPEEMEVPASTAAIAEDLLAELTERLEEGRPLYSIQPTGGSIGLKRASGHHAIPTSDWPAYLQA